eukprot:1527783-Pleurochrysis_carterae.AAC.1
MMCIPLFDHRIVRMSIVISAKPPDLAAVPVAAVRAAFSVAPPRRAAGASYANNPLPAENRHHLARRHAMQAVTDERRHTHREDKRLTWPRSATRACEIRKNARNQLEQERQP